MSSSDYFICHVQCEYGRSTIQKALWRTTDAATAKALRDALATAFPQDEGKDQWMDEGYVVREGQFVNDGMRLALGERIDMIRQVLNADPKCSLHCLYRRTQVPLFECERAVYCLRAEAMLWHPGEQAAGDCPPDTTGRASHGNLPEAAPAREVPAVTETTVEAAISKKARALAALTDHPDWTDEQIALAAGCHVKSLYRWAEYVRARELLRGGCVRLPRGTRDSETGEMEAWDDDEPGAERE